MFDGSRGQCRIGVAVPYTNRNLEPDLIAMRPAGASLHMTRIGGYRADSTPGAAEMRQMAEAPVDDAIDLLAAVRPDVLLYGCLSATVTIGRAGDRTFADDLSARYGFPVITAAGAIVDALNDLGLRGIAVCSPYERRLSDLTAAFFRSAGFDVASTSNPDRDLDCRDQGAMTPREVMELALGADSAAADAVVVACTDLRAVECLDALEARLRKPVVASNQALLYAALKALAIEPATVPGALGRHGPSLKPERARSAGT